MCTHRNSYPTRGSFEDSTDCTDTGIARGLYTLRRAIRSLPTILAVIALTQATLANAGLAAHATPFNKPLQGVTICVDPGHPSETSAGTETPDHTLTERHVNWVVSLLLRHFLREAGATVVMTKSYEKQFVTNQRRAEIANAAHAELFLRLHCDYADESGFAVFYPNHAGTVRGHRGPSASVMAASHRLADILHTGAMNSLGSDLSDRGVRGENQTAVGRKQGALTGSIFAKEPALTVEMCVLNQQHDIYFLKQRDGYRKLAVALFAGAQACFPK